jgi:hypothetical protein
MIRLYKDMSYGGESWVGASPPKPPMESHRCGARLRLNGALNILDCLNVLHGARQVGNGTPMRITGVLSAMPAAFSRFRWRGCSHRVKTSRIRQIITTGDFRRSNKCECRGRLCTAVRCHRLLLTIHRTLRT